MRKIRKYINLLAQLNDSHYIKDKAVFFIENHFTEFKNDYNSTRRGLRWTTGKLERELFILIGKLCRGSNRGKNSKYGRSIMIECGYTSYKSKEKRFVQKMENYKKHYKTIFDEDEEIMKNMKNSKNNEEEREMSPSVSSDDILEDQNSLKDNQGNQGEGSSPQLPSSSIPPSSPMWPLPKITLTPKPQSPLEFLSDRLSLSPVYYGAGHISTELASPDSFTDLCKQDSFGREQRDEEVSKNPQSIFTHSSPSTLYDLQSPSCLSPTMPIPEPQLFPGTLDLSPPYDYGNEETKSTELNRIALPSDPFDASFGNYSYLQEEYNKSCALTVETAGSYQCDEDEFQNPFYQEESTSFSNPLTRPFPLETGTSTLLRSESITRDPNNLLSSDSFSDLLLPSITKNISNDNKNTSSSLYDCLTYNEQNLLLF